MVWAATALTVMFVISIWNILFNLVIIMVDLFMPIPIMLVG